MAKISLNQQIEEVDLELAQREGVYARLVSSGKMRKSVAEFKTERMKAVKTTLEWLRENEDKIRNANEFLKAQLGERP